MGYSRSAVLVLVTWGQENIHPGFPWKFGDGGLSLSSSSSHNYASFLGRNIIQNFSNVTDSRSQTTVSTGKLSKSESTGGRDGGYR